MISRLVDSVLRHLPTSDARDVRAAAAKITADLRETSQERTLPASDDDSEPSTDTVARLPDLAGLSLA